MENIVFKTLSIEGWRQFDDVEIELHPSLTVLTGANGSGKTTLISLFAQHFGWNRNYLSTPLINEAGTLTYMPGILDNLWHKKKFDSFRSDIIKVGQFEYSNNINADICINNSQNAVYFISINSTTLIKGIHIDAYRPLAMYITLPSIRMSPMTAQQAYQNYNSEVLQQNMGHSNGSVPIMRIKEAIISMAVFGEGNSHIGGNRSLLDIFSGFSDVLKNILPESLGFERISVRPPEVVLETKSGEFMIDAASGGIITLIDISWRIYMFSKDCERFVVTIDEPENHLHPSMQRSLMRRLIEAFPNVQFIIATHSPFMVSSVKESNVYVLRYQSKGELYSEVEEAQEGTCGDQITRRVNSQKLSNMNKAASPNDILREVLGVSATIPEWVEHNLDELVDELRGKEITIDLLKHLRGRLSELGYDDYYTDALARLTNQ
jgi:predicted ATPase